MANQPAGLRRHFRAAWKRWFGEGGVIHRTDCVICFCEFPITQMLVMPLCQCTTCNECFKTHFETLIKTDPACIRKSSCPHCDKPDVTGGNADELEIHFNFLTQLLQYSLDKVTFDLFEQKLRDWNLQKEPNFRWCAKCASGVINESESKKMFCRECNTYTCFHCNRKWKLEHESKSCEEFADWMEEHDPDVQRKGLTAHLETNGISCPNCKYRYELAKGGCMHFTCSQCGHQFCSGCRGAFKKEDKCNKFSKCAKLGLHAHHPRTCLSYLRDYDIGALQNLLKKHKWTFTTNADNENFEACQVMEQKNCSNVLMDSNCGKDTFQRTGLCQTHYVEYLVGLINRHSIDPLEIFPDGNIQALLQSNDIHFRQIGDGENNGAYRKYLTKLVQEKLPLERNQIAREEETIAAEQETIAASEYLLVRMWNNFLFDSDPAFTG